MFGFKFIALAVALASVASGYDGGRAGICVTAPAVTTTVTITECGGQPASSTLSLSSAIESSWSSVVPIVSSEAPLPPVPSQSAPVTLPAPGPAPSGSTPAPAPASSTPAPEPAPPGSTLVPGYTSAEPTESGSSGTHSPTHPASVTPSNSVSSPSPSGTDSAPPVNNAAQSLGIFSGMGSIFSAGIVISAMISVLI